jgi:hypothetical protein
MFASVAPVRISLASIVLDRPDRSGVYIAKDLAGGWAYLVADADGDNRYRGQGFCAGGVDVALRCAFLSAASRVPECGQMTLLVQDRQAHQAMVRLAMSDPHVVAAIAGRQVAVMTRPQERSCFHVRSAAERVAAAALDDRERAEWYDSGVIAQDSVVAPAEAETPQQATPDPVVGSNPVPNWRVRNGALAQQNGIAVSSALQVIARNVPAEAGPVATVPRRPSPRRRALAAWLSEFDNHVASLSADLRDVGA